MFVPTTAVDLAPIMPGGCWDEASFHTVHENPYDESQAIAWLCVYAGSLINAITALEMYNTEIEALLNTGSPILCLCTVYTAL